MAVKTGKPTGTTCGWKTLTGECGEPQLELADGNWTCRNDHSNARKIEPVLRTEPVYQRASLERLMKLVSAVAGWGTEHHVVVSYTEVSRFVSHDETERTGKWVWLATIETCGDKTKVSAQGATLTAALYALALAVCQYFADSSRWSKDNNARAAQLVALFATEE